jgi:ABC-type transport system involved in cytochrome c biogenesis ATPase subunit
MRLEEIRYIKRFRSIVDVGPIALGDITLFVGPNNGGKSSVLRSVLALQAGLGVDAGHVRLGEADAAIAMSVRDAQEFFRQDANIGPMSVTELTVSLPKNGEVSITLRLSPAGTYSPQPLPGDERLSAIVPFLSGRRPESFVEDVREQNAMTVHYDMRFLAAKLARVAQPAHPAHSAYAEASKKIIGTIVTAVPSINGQLPGVFVGASEKIPLADMGAGVAHIVGLLAELALARDKIFVIEEPENDLHPAALRALLELIEQAAERNQFLISTHSNIVLRHLGALSSTRIHYVTADSRSWPPVTSVREVKPTSDQRSEILVDLGYEMRDFELFDGWLFLEEASAEVIVRDHLIPWFTPALVGHLRTISARGVSRVEPSFDDFNRLVLFTHLEARYRDRAWVLVDGDDAGFEVVRRLRRTYERTWQPDRFNTLMQPLFERYYPPDFEQDVETVLATRDRQERRRLKKHLLLAVLDWIQADEEHAKAAFAESAAEIISHLRTIEAELGHARAEPTSV